MAYWLKTKRTRKHATLNSLTEPAILSLVAKLGLKCHSNEEFFFFLLTY